MLGLRSLLPVAFASLLAACLDTTGITSAEDLGVSVDASGTTDCCGPVDIAPQPIDLAGSSDQTAPPDLTPPSDLCTDNDKDGVTTCAGDCDDNDPDNYPSNNEICGDNRDNNCNLAKDESCNGLGTYVSLDRGNDANPGTQASPVKTINQGMKNAMMLGGGAAGQKVYVAGGHYGEKVLLVEGIDLLGGYDCRVATCTWKRDPKDPNFGDTAILTPDFEGVYAGKTITHKTTIDGFRLQGLTGQNFSNPYGGVAITLDQGTPTVTNNVINGGDVSGGMYKNSYGILMLGPSNDLVVGASVANNLITAGSPTNAGIIDASIAVSLAGRAACGSSCGTLVTLRNNTLRGGRATTSLGLLANTSVAGSLAQGNLISGGFSIATNAALGGGSWGVAVSGTLDLDGNHINTDTGNPTSCPNFNGFCGGVASYSSTSVMTNNVILGAGSPLSVGASLVEGERPAGAIIFNGNTVDPVGLTVTTTGLGTLSAGIYLRIGSCMTCGNNTLIGKIRNNLLLAGRATNRIIIMEDTSQVGKTAHPLALDNNDFWFVGASQMNDIFYQYWDGAAPRNVTMFNSLAAQVTTPTPIANINGDPLLDAQYHLLNNSACINTGTLNEAPPRDIDGESRPKGGKIDIGCDEAQ